jgi:hypothetical protein
MSQKKKRRLKAPADLAREGELDEQLRTLIYQAATQAKRSGLYVVLSLPRGLLAELLDLDERRKRQCRDN